MTRHGSASLRKQEQPKFYAGTNSPVPVIDANLKRRARRLIINSRLPHSVRNMLRYALSIKDPYLPQLVRRVESGETEIDSLDKVDTPLGKRPAL